MRGWIMASFLLASTAGLPGCNLVANTGSDDGRAVWDDDAARQLEQAIAARAAHGLDQIDFTVDADPDSEAGRAELNRVALAFAEALARGVADPSELYDLYTLPRPDPDLKSGLQNALASGDIEAWLQGLAPQDANYRKLSARYLALRSPDSPDKPVVPPPSEPLAPGVSDPRIPAIARQLIEYDYLARPQAGDRYTPAMVEAVKQMQADYGVKADGVIGEDMVAILNLTDAERARAIAVNLERLRWLERDPPATRIDVNLAVARMSYWRDGKLVDVRKVVVGKPDNPTPQLSSPIYRLVANPTWTVPRSIQEKEIAPKGPGYLEAHDMRWQDGWIVQGSGPRNSLGLVKFDMVNDHAIYLHDTPAKALFKASQRQRSHGCVRVADATGFAELLARDNGVTDAWQKARATGEQTFVPIEQKIAVRMLYQTILFDDSGNPVLRADPYEWNDSIAAKLGFAPRTSYRLKSVSDGVGP